MQSAMQMQNASRIFTVAPWSGLQQVIHSVEASCMRGERVENGEPRRESHHVGEQRSFSSREGGEARSKPQFRGARAQVDAKGSGDGSSLRGVSGDKVSVNPWIPKVSHPCFCGSSPFCCSFGLGSDPPV